MKSIYEHVKSFNSDYGPKEEIQAMKETECISVISDDMNSDNTFDKILYILIKASIPVSANFFFHILLNTITLVYIGSFNDTFSLSFFAFAYSFHMIFAEVGIMALPVAIKTLCSHAYGSKKYNLIGIYSSIGIIVNLFYLILIYLPLIYFSPNIVGLFKDVEFAKATSKYLIFSIPADILQSINIPLEEQLQSMKIFNVITLIGFVGLTLYPLWLYFFITFLNLNVYGVPFANLFYGIVQASLFSYIFTFSNIKTECKSFLYSKLNMEFFNRVFWYNYLRISINTFLDYFLEVLISEMSVFLVCFFSQNHCGLYALFPFRRITFSL